MNPYIVIFETVKKQIDCPSVRRQLSINCSLIPFPYKMATLRNKRLLAALNEENCKENPRSNLECNSNVLRSQEDDINQISHGLEIGVGKKLSKEFSSTESSILGALSWLDEFLFDPLNQGHSKSAREASRNAHNTNQGTNEDDYQSDLRLEARVSDRQTTQVFGPGDSYDMVTRVHEEIPHCNPGTSSGNQKQMRSTSPAHVCSPNTPATIEQDNILLALQQLAFNNISADFHNNVNRISKLPKSLDTMTLRFDGKSEKFELFEHLFQTGLKIHNRLTEDDRKNHFQSLNMRNVPQIFRNINGRTWENLVQFLAVFRRKYQKPLSIARRTIYQRQEANKSQLPITISSTCPLSIKVQQPRSRVLPTQRSVWIKNDASWSLDCRGQRKNNNPPNTDH